MNREPSPSLPDRWSAHWAGIPPRDKLIIAACVAALVVFYFVATGNEAACRQLHSLGDMTDANAGAWLQLRFQCNPLAE